MEYLYKTLNPQSGLTLLLEAYTDVCKNNMLQRNAYGIWQGIKMEPIVYDMLFNLLSNVVIEIYSQVKQEDFPSEIFELYL